MNRRILIVCVLGAVACILPSCTTSQGAYKVGQHTVVITETALWSSGPMRGTLKGADDSYEYFTYEGHHLEVRLENEVLTVNGTKYSIPNKTDSITIRNERVEIGGQPAKPMTTE